jgi:3-phenylpropionate/trans-cinnamate dioxygenase ferredoxin subunit
VPEVEVFPLDELGPDEMKHVSAGGRTLCVYNLGGELYAIEDRCSHDDGPLCEGDWDPDEGVVICPRHGANFDLRTGEALTLPAFTPVETFPVLVENGVVKVELPEF